MSKYGEFETKFTDGALLADCLKSMGFAIECHDTPQTLFGYHGDPRAEKANIIIRRHHTGIDASNDVGFLKQEDGSYKAIISQYDHSAKFTDQWMGGLKQAYTEQRQMAVARTKGYVFLGRETVQTEKGQRVRLTFGKR